MKEQIMMDNTQVSDTKKQPSSKARKRHLKVNEINYSNNLESDYTEKIEALEKSFDYDSNSTCYWSKPELSIFYGTPLYQGASEAQKLALNHLYWVANYDHTAASEASTVHYNQVTAGVFSQISDSYEALCLNLKHEAEQEKFHIHAFQNIGHKTKTALLGKRVMGIKLNKNSRYKKSGQLKLVAKLPEGVKSSLGSSNFQYNSLRYLSKLMLNSETYRYSQYLQDFDKKGEPLTAIKKGYVGVAIPQNLVQFFTFCWGSSPFLACQYYAYRYAGNAVLKNYEYEYSEYFRKLEKDGKCTSVPQTVSHYHFLDESFHTTTSQLIARDMYKDFGKPTTSEQVIANVIFYLMQSGFLGGLPGGLIGSFVDESLIMPLYYRILRSPVFDMSAQDALHWMEKCLCHEHEGFHLQTKYHQRAMKNIGQLASSLDYLWPINREMRIMASGGSISKAIANNVKALKQFSKIAVV